MLVDEPFDRFFSEVPALETAFREQQVPKHVSVFVTHPVIDRNTKSHFGAILNGCWQEIAERFDQDFLAASRLKLQFNRHMCREFGDTVIHKGASGFEPVSHAGDVHFGQDVAWEIRLDIDAGGPRDKISLRALLVGVENQVPAVKASEMIRELGCVEFVSKLLVEDSDPSEIPPFW